MSKKDYASRARDYLAWSSARRGVFIPLAHIRICEGDVVAAALLSQIVYWFHPSSTKATKATIHRDGYFWIAKTWQDFEAEVGLSRRQVQRAAAFLRALEIVFSEVHGFAGKKSTFYSVRWEAFFDALDAVKEGEDQPSPFGPP